MKLLSLGAVLLVAVAALTGPPTTASQPKSRAVATVAAAPLRSAILYDITFSRASARVAASIEDFTPIFERLRVTGGEIGFGVVADDSDRPLVRCYVPTPPEPPMSPEATNTNIFISANNQKRHDAARKAYAARQRAWEADVTSRIDAFIAAVTPLLTAPPSAGNTDFTAAVERGDLMLAEPSRFQHAETVIVLISDGIHNATAKVTPVLRSNAPVAIVNGVGSVGALANLHPKPLRFESTAAAMRFFSGGAYARD